MKNNIRTFIKKHIRISLVIIFFIALIFLPQFNFCSSKQLDVSSINVIVPDDKDEFPINSKVYIRWSTSNNSNVALLPNSAYLPLTKNSLINNNLSKADLGINSTLSAFQRNSILRQILKRSQTTCDVDCNNACDDAVGQVVQAILIGTAVVGGVILFTVGAIIIGVVLSRRNKTPSDGMNIDLLRGDDSFINLAKRTPNDGVFEWVIPRDLPPDDNYAIKISVAEKPDVFAISDGYFTVTPEKPDENGEEENSDNIIDEDTDEPSNNTVENGNEETKEQLISKARRNTYSYLDKGIKGFDASLLPDGMKHYVYFNLDNIDSEMNDISGKNERVLNKFLSKTVKDNLASYLLPYERDIANKIAENTFKENMELFSEVKEIIMGIETITNYPERPPMTILALVEDAEVITDRLSGQPEVFIKDSIEGLDVYKSNVTNTIIFNENVIGVTTAGLEHELVKSFNKPNAVLKDKINREHDLIWSNLDVAELKYDINFSAMNIDPNNLDKLNLNISQYENGFNISSELTLKNTEFIGEYTSILNDMLNIIKIPAKTAIAPKNTYNDELLTIMNNVNLKSDESAIYANLKIQNETINEMFE